MTLTLDPKAGLGMPLLLCRMHCQTWTRVSSSSKVTSRMSVSAVRFGYLVLIMEAEQSVFRSA